jgi:hypothetical protein
MNHTIFLVEIPEILDGWGQTWVVPGDMQLVPPWPKSKVTHKNMVANLELNHWLTEC